MKRFTKRLIEVACVLSMLMLVGPAVLHADEVSYEISFTADSGPAPSRATYTYDTVTKQFSGFVLNMFGRTFDFGASFNNTFELESSPYFAALLAGGDWTWLGISNSGHPDLERADTLLLTIGGWNLYVKEYSDFDPANRYGTVVSQGSVRITPVPEPETLSLCTIGLVGLFLIGVVRKRRHPDTRFMQL